MAGCPLPNRGIHCDFAGAAGQWNTSVLRPLYIELRSNDGRVGYDLLTSREREVLQLIAEGHSNQQIAQELFISVKTVEAHRAHIMSKLHARNRTDLIRYALRKGIVGFDHVPVDSTDD